MPGYQKIEICGKAMSICGTDRVSTIFNQHFPEWNANDERTPKLSSSCRYIFNQAHAARVNAMAGTPDANEYIARAITAINNFG